MTNESDLNSLLEAVHSDDLRTATDALFFLSVKVCTQGVAVNRETVPALPVIIDIIATDGSHVRNGLLQLVFEIARASHAWRKAERNFGRARIDSYSEEIAWELEVDRMIAEAVPIFGRLATDRDPEFAAMARALFERYHKT